MRPTLSFGAPRLGRLPDLRCAGSVVLMLAMWLPTSLWAQQPERLTSWTHPVFPVAEYVARRAALGRLLADDQVLLVPSAEGTSKGETFRQLDDFEYLAGLEIARAVLAVDGRTRRTLLFVPRTDARFENRGRPNDFPGRPLASDPSLHALSGVDSVLTDDALDAYVGELAGRGITMLVNTGRAESAVNAPLSAFIAKSPGELLAAALQQQQPRLKVGNGYRSLAALRMIKTPREVAALRETARLTTIAMARGAARVRPGIAERALIGAFSADCQSLGAARDAFTPIIKSGSNSLWPWRILGAHYERRNRAMRAGELVIYDVGCEHHHYVSDVGRTFPVGTQFSRRQRELVDMVREVSDAVIRAARPGLTLAALQRAAIEAIPASARPYMQAPLYFGHHIGLDTGDPSLAEAVLEPGMVFTIEPWYYNHDEQVAAFIEDEILITKFGSESITADLPRTATGLEAMRNGRTPWLTAAAGRRTLTLDGVLSFALDKAAGVVRVTDLLNGAEVGEASVCAQAISGELTPDDVSFAVRCPGTTVSMLVNTASYTVTPGPRAVRIRRPNAPARGKNEVVVIGTIHGAHRTSVRYGTDVLRRLLQAIRPDVVLTEIAPNRFDAAAREFATTGTITEPRVARFPEYVDVLFPLTRTEHFTIVPTAGWTRPMDIYRTAALARIGSDSNRAAEWQEYKQAEAKGDSLVALHGPDDPYFINSAAYDDIQTVALEPYNRLFNIELGPGGWDNVNEVHYGNIARALDAHRGEHLRFVITYGAGHKEWFMRELRKRTDITMLEVAPFLRRIGAH